MATQHEALLNAREHTTQLRHRPGWPDLGVAEQLCLQHRRVDAVATEVGIADQKHIPAGACALCGTKSPLTTADPLSPLTTADPPHLPPHLSSYRSLLERPSSSVALAKASTCHGCTLSVSVSERSSR